MKGPIRWRRRGLGALVAALSCAGVLGGCAVGPDFRAPAAVADSSYTSGALPSITAHAEGPGGAAQTFVNVESIGGAWWRAFGSDDLNRLVEQALAGTPTLEAAQLRLEQAREDYRAQAGTLVPQVDATLNDTREKISSAAIGGGILGNRAIPPFSLYQANVMSYAFDLFGRNRRALEGLAAGVDYRQYELDAARLALAGNIVITAIRRASLAAQIRLTEQLVAARAQQFDIARQRWQAGGIAEADVLSQRSQLEQARAGIAPLRAQLAQADHQLATYLGRTPAQGTPPLPDLDALALPTEVPVLVPAALTRQRPDVRASEALLHQANADVGIATANLYPQLNLTGSLGGAGTKLTDLANVWSLGLAAAGPIFHGGQLEARKRSAEDAYEVAAANHRQTVLQALQQVADVLRALEHDATELAARDQAQRDAAAAARVAHLRYDVGGLSLVGLIDAERTELQTAVDRVRVQAQRLADTAALYQALGAKV